MLEEDPKINRLVSLRSFSSDMWTTTKLHDRQSGGLDYSLERNMLK